MLEASAVAGSERERKPRGLEGTLRDDSGAPGCHAHEELRGVTSWSGYRLTPICLTG